MASANVVDIYRDLKRYGISSLVLVPIDGGTPVILHAPDVITPGFAYASGAKLVACAPGVTTYPPIVGAQPIIIHAPSLAGIDVTRLVSAGSLVASAPALATVATLQTIDYITAGVVMRHAPDVSYTGGIFDQSAGVDAGMLLAVAPEIAQAFGALIVDPSPIVVHAPQPAAQLEVGAYVHGYVRYIDVDGVSWATIHDATTGTSASATAPATVTLSLEADSNTDEWEELGRYAVTFDLSGVPTDASISKAYFKLCAAGGALTDFNGDAVMSSFSPASKTNYVTTDYDAFGDRDLSDRVPVSDMSLGSDYNGIFTLNARGMADLHSQLGGYAVFGMRFSYDIDNNEPTWGAADEDQITAIQEPNDASVPPLLVLEYGRDRMILPIPTVLAAPAVTTSGGLLTETLGASNGGYITYSQLAGASWSAIRDNATGSASDGAGITPSIQIDSDADTDEWDWMYRGALTFDLSSLPAKADIKEVTLRVKATSTVSDFGGDLAVCSFSPADPDNYASGDYDAFGTTDWATQQAISGISTSAYTDLEFNATGVAGVQAAVGSTFTVGMRIDWDLENNEPTWAADNRDVVQLDNWDDTVWPARLIVKWEPVPPPASVIVHAPAVTTSGGA